MGSEDALTDPSIAGPMGDDAKMNLKRFPVAFAASAFYLVSLLSPLKSPLPHRITRPSHDEDRGNLVSRGHFKGQ